MMGLGLLGAACGGNDVTTLSVLEADEGPVEPATASRTFEVLSDGESLDVMCRFIGVSSVAGTSAADAAACSATVEACRANVEAALGGPGDGPDVGLPATDLDAVLGCPLTLDVLDRCIAAALERGVATYGSSIRCDMPALPVVDSLTLFATPACLAVALQCPELVASLAGPSAASDPQ